MKNADAKGGIKTEIDKNTKIIGKNAEKNWGRKENTASNLSSKKKQVHFVMYSQFYLQQSRWKVIFPLGLDCRWAEKAALMSQEFLL